MNDPRLQDEVSKSMSREISGENITISSSLIEEAEMIDRVQLTVSSVNTVLEDLPETEDEHDYDNCCEKDSKEAAPLLPQIKLDEKVKFTKSTTLEGSVQPHNRTTIRVIRTNRPQTSLKVETGDVLTTNGSTSSSSLSKTVTIGSNNALFAAAGGRAAQVRQGAGVPSASLTNGTILPGSKSATSSRHNSGDSNTKLASVLKNKHCVSVTNTSSGAPIIVSPVVTAIASSTSNVTRDRERSPCVSFGTDVVYVESAIPDASGRRPRSRSDASSRFRSSSVVDWHKSKIAWLRERREQRRKEGSEKSLVTKKDSKEEEPETVTPETETTGANGSQEKEATAPEVQATEKPEVAATDLDDELPPTPRARARSEKFFRPTKKDVLGEVSKKTPFDWPLGRLGKLRQKYSKKDEYGSTTPPKHNFTVRSVSVAALTKHEADRYSSRLKRNNSEKQKDKQKHRVAFDKSYSSSTSNGNWISKLFFDKSKQNKKRRRHPTDPDSSEFCC